MKIMITNDDGIDAPGIQMLQRVVAEFAEPIVVAPQEHLSGCSHQVNVGRAIKVQSDANWHAVDGTPADCTRLGLLYLAADVDWVFSGVNDGGNLGVDVFMSGTVAGVREAALCGKPGIAFSQYRRNMGELDWNRYAPLVSYVLESLWREELNPGEFWNVNFPFDLPETGLPGIVHCPLDRGHLPMYYEVEGEHFRYRSAYGDRPRVQGSDVDICFGGGIAVTRMHVWC